MKLAGVEKMMAIRDHHSLNSEETNRENLYALADSVPDLVGEVKGLRRTIQTLMGILFARRAMEPQHSDPEHDCRECEYLSEVKHSDVFRDYCEHDWKDIRNEIVTRGEMCSKCGALR